MHATNDEVLEASECLSGVSVVMASVSDDQITILTDATVEQLNEFIGVLTRVRNRMVREQADYYPAFLRN
jgi:hypothetical protein